MPARLIIAYALIAVLLVAATGFVLWLRHNTPAQAHARDRKRREERDKLAAEARK